MMEKSEVYKSIKAATVAIALVHPDAKKGKKQQFTILGSGFCIDKNGIIVTCEHVISAFMQETVHEQIAKIKPEESKKEPIHSWPVKIAPTYVLFYKHLKTPSEKLHVFATCVVLSAASTDFDLAVAKIHLHPAFPEGYPTVEIEDFENINEGDEVGICGFPLGNFLYEKLGTVSSSFSKGIISSIIPAAGAPQDCLEGFQLNLTATHGNSGGPVFSLETGKVFGVLAEGIKHPKTNRPVQGLVKAEPLYPLFKDDTIERMKKLTPGGIPDFPGYNHFNETQ